MFSRNIPEFLRHARTPGVRGFAVLSGAEAALRAMLVSVWPLVIFRSEGEDAVRASLLYLAIGAVSLAWGLMVPWLSTHVPRRWLYSLGVSFYFVSGLLGAAGTAGMLPVALLFGNLATVTVFICFNAYVMDYIARQELGRVESQKLFYSGISWMLGPMLGVFLWRWWEPLPFLITMVLALVLMATFWVMRLGNGKLITRARVRAPNPLAYLGRFLTQPRLIAGWLFAVFRSTGWWVYIVYLPMFAVGHGLGHQVGSIAFSLSNALLLTAPLILAGMQRLGLRRAVRGAFAGAALSFLLAGFAPLWPPLAVIALFAGSVFLVMLDTFGGLPFLMAVRPAERTEMAAVYASYRDVSGILSPGVAWTVLLVAPIPGVFVACGAGLAAMAALAGLMHPRLGAPRGLRRASG